MILAVRACIALSSITSRTRQTHRTPGPWREERRYVSIPIPHRDCDQPARPDEEGSAEESVGSRVHSTRKSSLPVLITCWRSDADSEGCPP
jgi:hypothetical protein